MFNDQPEDPNYLRPNPDPRTAQKIRECDAAYLSERFQPIGPELVHGYSVESNQPTVRQNCGGYVLAGLIGGPYAPVTHGAAWDVVSLFGQDVTTQSLQPWDVLVHYTQIPDVLGIVSKEQVQHYGLVEEGPTTGKTATIVSKNGWERIYRGPLDTIEKQADKSTLVVPRYFPLVNERVGHSDMAHKVYRLTWDSIKVTTCPHLILELHPTALARRGELIRGKLAVKLHEINRPGWPTLPVNLQLRVTWVDSDSGQPRSIQASKDVRLDARNTHHEFLLENTFALRAPDDPLVEQISLKATAHFTQVVCRRDPRLPQRPFESPPVEVELKRSKEMLEVRVKDAATDKYLADAKVELTLEDNSTLRGVTIGNRLPESNWMASVEFKDLPARPEGTGAKYKIRVTREGYEPEIAEWRLMTGDSGPKTVRLRPSQPVLVLTLPVHYEVSRGGGPLGGGVIDRRNIGSASGRIQVESTDTPLQDIWKMNGYLEFSFPPSINVSGDPNARTNVPVGIKAQATFSQLGYYRGDPWECAILANISGDRDSKRSNIIQLQRGTNNATLDYPGVWAFSWRPGQSQTLNANVIFRGYSSTAVRITATYRPQAAGTGPLPTTSGQSAPGPSGTRIPPASRTTRPTTTPGIPTGGTGPRSSTAATQPRLAQPAAGTASPGARTPVATARPTATTPNQTGGQNPSQPAIAPGATTNNRLAAAAGSPNLPSPAGTGQTLPLSASRGQGPNSALAPPAKVLFSDSFDRPDANAPGGEGALRYVPIFGRPDAPTGASIAGNALQHNGRDYGGVSLGALPQDLNIQMDLLVPTDEAGHVSQAGPFIRNRALNRGDGILGGASAGYWVQIHSTGEVKVKELNAGVIVAATGKPASFDTRAFHTLQLAAGGERLQIALDGKILTFQQNGRQATTLSIPASWEGKGRNQGGAGIAFGCEDNRGQIGGQRADNLKILEFRPLAPLPVVGTAPR